MSFFNWLESNLVNPFPNSTVKNLVYHGTTKNKFNNFTYQKSKRFILFSEFDVEAKGFFFSESPHDAVTYGENVVSCYVNLTNPLIDPRRDKHLSIDQLDDKKIIDLQKILAPLIQKDKYGKFIDIGVSRYHLKGGMDWVYHAVSYQGLEWDVLDNPVVIQRMLKLGYDGTFVAESNDQIGRSIFVPSAEQVKIVGWTRGVQDEWGDADDYYTKKKDGYDIFYNPSFREN